MSLVQLLFKQFSENNIKLVQISHNFDRTFDPPTNNTVHIFALKLDPDQLPHTIENQNTPTPRG